MFVSGFSGIVFAFEVTIFMVLRGINYLVGKRLYEIYIVYVLVILDVEVVVNIMDLVVT